MEKTRPGRPSRRPPAPVVEKCGIVYRPKGSLCCLEIAHDTHIILKTLFSSTKLKLSNQQKKITFISAEPQTSSICNKDVAVMVGKNLNWYFCESPTLLCLNRESADALFSCIYIK